MSDISGRQNTHDDCRLALKIALVDFVLGDRLLTYLSDGPLTIGTSVVVPFGKKESYGFVVSCRPVMEAELEVPVEALRFILYEVKGMSLPKRSLELMEALRRHTSCTYAQALSAILPAGMRDQVTTAWVLTDKSPVQSQKKRGFELEPDDERPLTPNQKEVLRILKDAGGMVAKDKAKKMESQSLRTLLSLQKQGYVLRQLLYQPPAERRQSRQLYSLNEDHQLLSKFIESQSKKKPAQVLVVLRLQESEGATFTSSEIKALAGVTDVTVRALIGERILVPVESILKPKLAAPPTPNVAQNLAIEAVKEAIYQRESKGFLLFGVTGSGKTEVYLRAASEAIKEGRQVVYLVPEIALASQAILRLRERYGESFTVIHSELSAGDRLLSFQQIRDGTTPLALGARSALFAPYEQLGLIIVDEEHEPSYKQDAPPRYHAVELAFELGKIHSCPVLVGSATPSIERFYAAEQGKLTLLSLPQRAAGAELPEIEIYDISAAYRNHTQSILGELLRFELEKVIAEANQAILFLNRRAYAPFLQCRNCGAKSDCPRCSVTLSYHAQEQVLRCHHCGHSELPPDVCPKCLNPRINPIGVGTEKVEEALRALFPEVSIGRLDRDIARKKGQLEQVLADFRSGAIQVLVGTQMVAKGLDFPNVTLVGVIMADISLNLPDFRAGEKTFQLLSQVSGRAGRGRKKGKVIIQTFNPENAAIQAAQTHNFISYYEAIKAERELAEYPPFKDLVNIVASSESRPAVILAAEQMEKEIQRQGTELRAEFEILGPVDCSIERLRDRWRRHLMIKLPPGSSSVWISKAIQPFRSANVQITFDPNPYSMM